MARRWRLAAVVLLVLAAAGGAGWWWSRPVELLRLRADLDRTDPGWRLADLWAARRAEHPPGDGNAFNLTIAARRAVPAEFAGWEAKAYGPDGWWVPPDRANRQPFDPAAVAAWRAAAEAVAAGRRVTDAPPAGLTLALQPDLTAVLLPHLDDARRLAGLLRLDAVMAARHGDGAGAAASLRAVLAVARPLGREPFVVSQLTRSAVGRLAADGVARALAAGELPADGLARLQAALAEPTDWAAAARDWRAASDYEFDAVAAGDTALDRLLDPTADPAEQADRLRYRLALRDDQHRALARAAELVAILRRPAHEWQAAVAARPLPPADWQHLLSKMYARCEGVLVEAAVRHEAELRAAALAVACERFRLLRGRWPAALADLPPDLRPADVTDPHTGRPLVVRRLPDGLAVYSVGPDGRDDGGDFRPAPGHPPVQDTGARLWDPGERAK